MKSRGRKENRFRYRFIDVCVKKLPETPQAGHSRVTLADHVWHTPSASSIISVGTPDLNDRIRGNRKEAVSQAACQISRLPREIGRSMEGALSERAKRRGRENQRREAQEKVKGVVVKVSI